MSRGLVAIGTVVKAFGIRGELVVSPMTDDVRRFKKLKRVFVGTSPANATETCVTGVVLGHRGVRVRLAAIGDRTEAEKLAGTLLFVDETEAVRPKRGSFFIHDIIGLRVFDEGGESLGVVKDVLKLPANDVYVIESKGSEILLPAVKEFIRDVDTNAKTMRVKLIAGMKE